MSINMIKTTIEDRCVFKTPNNKAIQTGLGIQLEEG